MTGWTNFEEMDRHEVDDRREAHIQPIPGGTNHRNTPEPHRPPPSQRSSQAMRDRVADNSSSNARTGLGQGPRRTGHPEERTRHPGRRNATPSNHIVREANATRVDNTNTVDHSDDVEYFSADSMSDWDEQRNVRRPRRQASRASVSSHTPSEPEGARPAADSVRDCPGFVIEEFTLEDGTKFEGAHPCSHISARCEQLRHEFAAHVIALEEAAPSDRSETMSTISSLSDEPDDDTEMWEEPPQESRRIPRRQSSLPLPQQHQPRGQDNATPLMSNPQRPSVSQQASANVSINAVNSFNHVYTGLINDEYTSWSSNRASEAERNRAARQSARPRAPKPPRAPNPPRPPVPPRAPNPPRPPVPPRAPRTPDFAPISHDGISQFMPAWMNADGPSMFMGGLPGMPQFMMNSGGNPIPNNTGRASHQSASYNFSSVGPQGMRTVLTSGNGGPSIVHGVDERGPYTYMSA